MSATLLEWRHERLPVETAPLPGGFTLLSVTPPTALLDSEQEELREAIVSVSDRAFGAATARSWSDKFSVDFLGGLHRFYLVADEGGALVGWSGYRARTIGRERVLYFTSSGLLPEHQGCGLIPAVQHLAMEQEALRNPRLTLTLAIRTRNPHAYRLAMRTFPAGFVVPGLDGSVPAHRRAIVAAVASWLGLPEVDSSTAIARGAYPAGGLYGSEPRCGDSAVNDLFARLGPQDAILVLATADS